MHFVVAVGGVGGALLMFSLSDSCVMHDLRLGINLT